MDPAELRELVRQEVRVQMSSAGRRYLPLLVAVATLLLLVVVVPDRQQSDVVDGALGGPTSGQIDGGSSGSTTSGGAGAGTSTGSGNLPGATSGGTTPGSSGGSTTGASGSTGAGSGGSSTGGISTTGSSTAGQSAQSGIARNGTKCGPGVRQFAFSPYAPPCVPAFTGNNGGATAHGVTASTITLTMRNTSDYDAGAQAVGASSFAAGEHDVKVIVDYFNKQFELYGRKVVVKSFNGQGSYLSEVGGQDQAGASADAQKAYDLGSFVEGIPPSPNVYSDALASRKIINFGLPISLADAKANYPYKYQSLTAVPDVAAQGMADLICQRMKGLPAIYAGDAALKQKQRTFAALTPQQGGDEGGNNVIFSRAKQKCGVDVAKHQYDANPARGASQAAQIAAKLKADGITTVVLFSNVVFAPIMTNSAAQSDYHPEWLYPSASSNNVARQMSPDAVKNMIFAYSWAPQNMAPLQSEGGRIYKLADPTGSPQSNITTLNLIAPILLELFRGLQAAGPQLTPASFGRGWFSLPPTAAGDFGKWTSSSTMFSPDSSYTLQWWNPTGTNAFDGGTGKYLACKEPADLPYINPSLGSGQLRCFT